MKEEDRRFYYRPDVAKDLQQAMDYALKLYEANIKRVYYVILSDIELDTEISQFLLETAKCFDGSFSGIEKFYRDYEYDLKHKYHIPLFNYEAVGSIVFPIYQRLFDNIKNLCFRDDFTKQERYNVDSFFNKLTAPLRNPNVYIQEGSHSCFYDENKDPVFSFEKDIRRSIEYIKENCPLTIEIFNTPDEMEESIAQTPAISR